MANITIDAAAATLKRYPVAYAKQWASVMRQSMEWENPAIAKPRQALHTYTSPAANVGEVLQAYQCPWTPKGTVNFTGVDTQLFRIKWDFELTCDDIETFYASWMSEWVELDKDPVEWSLARYIYEQVVKPKITEEQNWNYYNAIYVAPTPGTAGASIASMTGLKKKIADYITGGDIVPVVTGAITSANVVDKVETFTSALPPVHQKTAGKILMSQTMANWYYRDYRAKFGTGNGIIGNDNPGLAVDNTNKVVVGMASMEGSQRIIFNPDMIWVKRIGEAYMPEPVIVHDIRKLKMSIVYHRAIGTESFFNFYVNDQA